MSLIKISGNGSGTGVFEITSPSTNTNRTQTLPDATGTLFIPGNASAITSGAAIASTSGASIDFTGVPSWVKRVTVVFDGMSTTGTSIPLIQIGDSGGIETTGYAATAQFDYVGNGFYASTAGQPIDSAGSMGAGNLHSGAIIITLLGSNTWVFSGSIVVEGSVVLSCAGKKALTGTLDRVRITTVGGTDTFDAGSINILYE